MLRVRRIVEPIRVGQTLDSEFITVPGIVTGAAYADGDAIGTTIVFPNVLRPETLSGVLYSAHYNDLDDEGLQVDLVIFKGPPTYTPADNGAYAPTDADIRNRIAVISFAAFYNWSNNQSSDVANIGIGFANAAGPHLYGHLIARGALNIAAANLPQVRLVVLAD